MPQRPQNAIPGIMTFARWLCGGCAGQSLPCCIMNICPSQLSRFPFFISLLGPFGHGIAFPAFFSLIFQEAGKVARRFTNCTKGACARLDKETMIWQVIYWRMACYWWPLSRKLSPPPASMPQNSLQGFGLLFFGAWLCRFVLHPPHAPKYIFLWGLLYAIWCGLGIIILVAIKSVAYFKQAPDFKRPAWASGWILLGVVVINVFQVPQGI